MTLFAYVIERRVFLWSWLLLNSCIMFMVSVCMCLSHDAPLLIGKGECFVAGMKDLGLYRVSGVLNEIQKLKKAFEKGELKEYIYI